MNVLPSEKLLTEYAPITPVKGMEEVAAHQATDVFALWQRWEAECGVPQDTPFWALVWPAARVLGRYVLDNPHLVKGKSILDLGCGCGAVAVAAVRAGAAAALGSDIDPVALHVAGLNAKANRTPVSFSAEDLTLAPLPPQGINLILIADMFYQKEPSSRMTAWLNAAHARGISIIVADSGRTFLPGVQFTPLFSTEVTVDSAVEGESVRRVDVLQWGG